MRQAHVDKVTRQVMGYGLGLTPTEDWDVVELADEEVAKLMQPGLKTLTENGEVTVTPTAPTPAKRGGPPPVVITGSRTTNAPAILAKLIDAIARGAPIINQTQA